MKIIIYEDEINQVKELRKWLGATGATILDSRRAVLKLILENPSIWQAVVLDINVNAPERGNRQYDGGQIGRDIASAVFCPIIYYSINITKYDVESRRDNENDNYYKSGRYYFISKATMPEELLPVVRTIVARHPKPPTNP